MKRKLAGLVLFTVAVLATALYHAGKVWATASNGFTASDAQHWIATMEGIDANAKGYVRVGSNS